MVGPTGLLTGALKMRAPLGHLKNALPEPLGNTPWASRSLGSTRIDRAPSSVVNSVLLCRHVVNISVVGRICLAR
jgi:hypothetical protein